MAVSDEARKRKRREDDRLSSLPDDILVDILSRLPLRLAMSTACFSSRWRGLWTHITSIHLISTDSMRIPTLNHTTFDETITRITSPSIRSFTLDFGNVSRYHPTLVNTVNLNYAWLRHICDRNLRELKAISTHNHHRLSKFILPGFVCQTQSLVSIELDTKWRLLLPDDGVPINLPNLKKLHLSHGCLNPNLKSLERLIEACPALQELSFQHVPHRTGSRIRRSTTGNIIINISHQNLRRLLVKGLRDNYRVVLNAPKLEYLAIHALSLATFSFEKELMVLSRAQIDFTNSCGGLITEDYIKVMSNFLRVFSNVVIHSPDVFVRHNYPWCWPLGMFCNATRLTLSLNMSYDINALSTLLELCPVLDILTLRIWDSNCYTIGPVGTLRRALKKMKLIETKCEANKAKPAKSFLEYLLCKFIDLKRSFRVKVKWSYSDKGSADYARNQERKLCKRLYNHPVVLGGCQIDFVGRFFKLSRKATRHKRFLKTLLSVDR